MRCVNWIILSCFRESVNVPEAYVSVGVMAISNERILLRRKHDFDVSSCLYLVNDVQAARSRLLISVVSCCSNVIVVSEIPGTFFH